MKNLLNFIGWLLIYGLLLPAKFLYAIINFIGVELSEKAKSKKYQGFISIVVWLISFYSLGADHMAYKQSAKWYPWYEGNKVQQVQVTNPSEVANEVFKKLNEEKKRSINLEECDANISGGCVIDLSKYQGIFKYDKLHSYDHGDYIDTIIETYEVIRFYKESENNVIAFDYLDTTENQLTFLQDAGKLYFKPFPRKISPYLISSRASKLHFKATLYHYTNFIEPIGWFDENEFQIEMDRNGYCMYHVCQDDKGIEITHKNGEVIFSLDYKYQNKFIFKGYFVRDSLIHVFDGESEFITENVNEAREAIIRIESIFDHRELNGSCERVKI